jgi:O-antigen/teichoic acid export membrane protein
MLGFLNAAMASATQRFMSYSEGAGDKEKQKSIFNISVILHFFIAITIGIVLLIAGYFFFHSILNIPAARIYAAQMVYYFMIVSTMLTVMTVPYDAVLNAHENMLYYAVVGIVESVLKLAVAFVVVYTLADKLIIYGALMTGISLLVMVIMRVYCKRNYEECVFKPRTYYNKALMQEMTGFAGWNFLTAFSSVVGQYGLGIVLNHFFGTLLNAAQGIANQLCGQLQSFSNTMLKALNPHITKSEGAGNRSVMLQSSLSGCKFSFFLVSFFVIPFLIDASYIMKIWLKNVPEYGVAFFRFQVIRTLIEQLTIVLGVSISAQGNIANISKIKSIINILPIILTSVVFYLGFSPYFMYIVWIACWSILGGIVSVYFAKINCGLSIKDFIKQVIIPCTCLFSIVYGLSTLPYLILQAGILRFICICVVSCISFILLSWRLALNEIEKKALRNLKTSLRNKVLFS